MNQEDESQFDPTQLVGKGAEEESILEKISEPKAKEMYSRWQAALVDLAKFPPIPDFDVEKATAEVEKACITGGKETGAAEFVVTIAEEYLKIQHALHGDPETAEDLSRRPKLAATAISRQMTEGQSGLDGLGIDLMSQTVHAIKEYGNSKKPTSS
jgi:hypothetical protein